MVKFSSTFLMSLSLGGSSADQRFNVKDDCDLRKEICIVFFEKKWKIEKCKIQILRISNERRLSLKKNEILKFEKIEICVFQQQPWDSVESFEKWKLSQKIEPADINLKISTKNGPQKLFDIKIRIPGWNINALDEIT